MKTAIKTLALALTICGITQATASTASAANRYAVVKIDNPLNDGINYQYRWGNGAWKSARVYAGHVMTHSWRYQFSDQNRSPNFQIRFDADPTSGVYTRHYTLSRYAVPFKTSGGKIYRFVFDSRGLLALRSVN